MNFNIAIDGPAGAGKSTIAKRVAQELGFVYVDTGAIYRSLALYFIRNGISAQEKETIQAVCPDLDVSIRYEDGVQQMYLNGENVTNLIRTEQVSMMTSDISKYEVVRDKLLSLQRGLAATHDVIMDGRDIGTCVLPNADLKIFLTAGSEERAKRRYNEQRALGISCDLARIERDIIARDTQDMNRTIAPLRQAADAILVDTSDMTIDEVTQKIVLLYQEKRRGGAE